MNDAIDLTPIYSLRSNFIIIGITGRTGSGCTDVANLLNNGFQDSSFTAPSEFKFDHNSFRKYRIVHQFAKENFKPFYLIEYKDILTLFILNYGYAELCKFLKSMALYKEFDISGIEISDFYKEIDELEKLKDRFTYFHDKLKLLKIDQDIPSSREQLFEIFDSSEFKEFSQEFHAILSSHSKVKRNKTLGIISNNLRQSGHPYDIEFTYPDCIFTIARMINSLIKAARNKNSKIQVVIDSLRNPLEIMFFRQRFASFYLISVNAEDEVRENNINTKYGSEKDRADKLFKEEYNGSKSSEFYKQKVQECIQLADIHVSYISYDYILRQNEKIEESKETKSPYFTWQMQVLKYISLILQPGIVTPSPEERCMQIALTAKYNSGCISRQVGAAITDEFYSLKAIGWNNTPEGQVPCNLRNVEDLINNENDLNAYTPFELESKDFREVVVENFKEQMACNKHNLNGRNVCMCFKSLRNSITEGKNQVHTRSLHAEESAFLQITKYGGNGIKGGKLFTTASPCELCSKKAYQLGIKVIYYIDPYPGISGKQILQAGDPSTQPEVRLFNGAIGKAYHWLYEPMMAYKDELSLLLGQKTKDLLSSYKEQIIDQSNIINAQLEIIAQLEAQVAGYDSKKVEFPDSGGPDQ